MAVKMTSSTWVFRHIPFEASESDIREAIAKEYRRKGKASTSAEAMVISHPRVRGEFSHKSKNPGYTLITVQDSDSGELMEVMRGYKFSAKRAVELERSRRSNMGPKRGNNKPVQATQP